jgi:hypothetical protein
MCDKQGSLFVPPLILMRHTKKIYISFLFFLLISLLETWDPSRLPLRMSFPASDEICTAFSRHPSPLLHPPSTEIERVLLVEYV